MTDAGTDARVQVEAEADAPSAGPADIAPDASGGGGAADAEDLALVERAREGDTDAFDELFRRYRDKVYGVVWGYVKNRDDALDVTQDAFLKAYRKLGSFRGRSKFFTWVTQIAINRAIDVRRKHMRRKDVQLGEHHDRDDARRRPGRSPASRPPEAGVQDEELKQKYQEAVDSLGEKHRTVFLLHTTEKLAYKEIAATLGISIGTVMSRLHYARKKLQKALEGYIDDDPRRRRKG
jgi:RNA polymerase sigma-70 factor (ECF subfamily)